MPRGVSAAGRRSACISQLCGCALGRFLSGPRRSFADGVQRNGVGVWLWIVGSCSWAKQKTLCSRKPYTISRDGTVSLSTAFSFQFASGFVVRSEIGGCLQPLSHPSSQSVAESTAETLVGQSWSWVRRARMNEPVQDALQSGRAKQCTPRATCSAAPDERGDCGLAITTQNDES